MADYPIAILPLSEEDGGGYVGIVPDLRGCISDGDTREEAIRNTQDAIRDWLAECRRLGRAVPEPGSSIERAKEDRRMLLNAVKTLAELCDHRDRQIEELVQAIEDMRQRTARDLPWSRLLDSLCVREQKSIGRLALVKH